MVKELIAANVLGIGCVLIGFGYLDDVTEKYLTNVIEIQSNRFYDMATIHKIHFSEHPSPEKLLSYFVLTSSYVPEIHDNTLTVSFDKIEVDGCSFSYNSVDGSVVFEPCNLTNDVKNSLNESFEQGIVE